MWKGTVRGGATLTARLHQAQGGMWSVRIADTQETPGSAASSSGASLRRNQPVDDHLSRGVMGIIRIRVGAWVSRPAVTVQYLRRHEVGSGTSVAAEPPSIAIGAQRSAIGLRRAAAELSM